MEEIHLNLFVRFLYHCHILSGYAVALLVEGLRYEVAGSIGIFH